ncbi:hypothetical protein HG530_003967 [Fusarium avenaceum]|nr:hypothetical protein HG530_003967 [Fusarium avenaceum]
MIYVTIFGLSITSLHTGLPAINLPILGLLDVNCLTTDLPIILFIAVLIITALLIFNLLANYWHNSFVSCTWVIINLLIISSSSLLFNFADVEVAVIEHMCYFEAAKACSLVPRWCDSAVQVSIGNESSPNPTWNAVGVALKAFPAHHLE